MAHSGSHNATTFQIVHRVTLMWDEQVIQQRIFGRLYRLIKDTPKSWHFPSASSETMQRNQPSVVAGAPAKAMSDHIKSRSGYHSCP